MALLELLHEPPDVASDKVVIAPWHMAEIPVIVPAVGATLELIIL